MGADSSEILIFFAANELKEDGPIVVHYHLLSISRVRSSSIHSPDAGYCDALGCAFQLKHFSEQIYLCRKYPKDIFY